MSKFNMNYYNEHKKSLFDIETYNKEMAPVRAAYATINFEEVADRLIDEMIEMNGVEWMIYWLKDFGLNEYQINAMGFSCDDIQAVFEDSEE